MKRLCPRAVILGIAVLFSGLGLSSFATVSAAESNDRTPNIDILLSGGGLRASAFSYGVLDELRKFCIKNDAITKLENGDCNEKDDSLLKHVKILSAVSGGAITAAYYQSHPDEFFERFPDLLRKSNLERRLVTTEKPLSLRRALRAPAFLLASLIDTLSAILSAPLFFLPLNIELTPLAVMTLSDGLLESDQLASVYKDLFYKTSTFGDLDELKGFPFEAIVSHGHPASKEKKPDLLINASDITNGTVFTFDKHTFKCMGAETSRESLPLAIAVAASSSLPGVFSPLPIERFVKSVDPTSIPVEGCPSFLSNRSRKLLLVDGGVSDNFGIVGLLRKVVRRKEGKGETSEENNESREKNTKDGDARGEKHFLIVVNAGVEADSKLPGLAGHFDSSYDLLIRGKKDLVRVMASDMLSHFGFGIAELRLSDLVTHQPEVKHIVRNEMERLSEGKNREEDVERAIPRVFNGTEQEQKLKGDLDDVGMLPSAEEIDTLIAAGRTVVAYRADRLIEAYAALRNKQFEPSCANISNPDKYFCWSDQFHAHDLDSGGGSAFLEILTEATTEFVETAAKRREEKAREIKENAAELIKQEELDLHATEDVIKKKVAVLLNETVKIIKMDEALQNLYEQAGIRASLPDQCKRAITRLEAWVKGKEDELQNQNLGKFLPAFETNLVSYYDLYQCSPNYHFLLTLTKYYQMKPGESGRELVSLLYRGLEKSHPGLNLMNLYQTLGPALIYFDANYKWGLREIEQALAIATEHEANLTRLKNLPQLSSHGSLVGEQIVRMKNAQKYFRVLFAQHMAVSPIPIPADPIYVSNSEVLGWERKHLRARTGISVLETILVHGVDETFKQDVGKMITLSNSVLGSPHLKEVIGELKELQKLLGETSRKGGADTKNGQPCGDDLREGSFHEHKRVTAEVCDRVAKIRSHIRSHLSQSAGLAKAERYIKPLYEEYKSSKGQEENKFLASLAPDILSTFGFVLINRHMNEHCPLRAQVVRKADALFREAIELSNGDNNGEQGPQLTRLTQYHQLAESLDCAEGTE